MYVCFCLYICVYCISVHLHKSFCHSHSYHHKPMISQGTTWFHVHYEYTFEIHLCTFDKFRNTAAPAAQASQAAARAAAAHLRQAHQVRPPRRNACTDTLLYLPTPSNRATTYPIFPFWMFQRMQHSSPKSSCLHVTM